MARSENANDVVLTGRPILIILFVLKFEHFDKMFLQMICSFIDKVTHKRSFWVTIRPIISEYLEVTTIHGLRYLIECRSVIEKVFWLVIICCSFAYSMNIILCFSAENDSKPILTTIETVSVKEVPFPAITIRHDFASYLTFIIVT